MHSSVHVMYLDCKFVSVRQALSFFACARWQSLHTSSARALTFNGLLHIRMTVRIRVARVPELPESERLLYLNCCMEWCYVNESHECKSNDSPMWIWQEESRGVTLRQHADLVYTYTYMYVYMSLYIHMYMCVYIYIYIYIYVYTYICTYIHIHIYVHIHIFTSLWCLNSNLQT